MMYEFANRDKYSVELAKATQASTKNANLIKKSMALPYLKFEKDVIGKLRKSVYDKNYFRKWLGELSNRGVLALDDYSIAVMYE